jgi:hypothetical protein
VILGGELDLLGLVFFLHGGNRSEKGEGAIIRGASFDSDSLC